MDSRQAFMLYACPALGAFVAFCMFVSPLRAVLRAQKHKQLGELNPLPFVFMAANGVGWLCYGLYIHDFFVFCSNIAALLLGLFYAMTCSKYAKEQVQDRLRNLLLGICVVFLAVALTYMGTDLGAQGGRMLWGVTANTILAVYYITPLSTLARVLSMRDSSSLHKPLLLANIVNGLLWFAYGLAIHDLMLIIPNAFGAGFNLISLSISFMFPARANKTPASNCTLNPTSQPGSHTGRAGAASRQGTSLGVERSASKPAIWLTKAWQQTCHDGICTLVSRQRNLSAGATAAGSAYGAGNGDLGSGGGSEPRLFGITGGSASAACEHGRPQNGDNIFHAGQAILVVEKSLLPASCAAADAGCRRENAGDSGSCSSDVEAGHVHVGACIVQADATRGDADVKSSR